MLTDRPIPIITSDSFHRSYFKHDPTHLSSHTMEPYFEINRRCIWKNTIVSHRLDFFMVFLVTDGEGIHTFGLKDHYIHKNMLCFVGPHMISAWQSEAAEHRGFFCGFSEEFINAGNENKQFLNELPFFHIDGNSVLHLNEDETHYYSTLFEMMQDEFENRNSYSHAVLRNELMVILNKAFAQYKTLGYKCPEPNDAGLRLLKAFSHLYRTDLETIRKGAGIHLKKISQYASELGVSQNHLNDTVKSITGRSAGQLIRDHLTSHATMCLMRAEKSISEVAYALGFEDPSYFARFYKSQTGKSPSELRINHKHP